MRRNPAQGRRTVMRGAHMAYVHCSCGLALYQLDTVHGPVNVCEDCDGQLIDRMLPA